MVRLRGTGSDGMARPPAGSSDLVMRTENNQGDPETWGKLEGQDRTRDHSATKAALRSLARTWAADLKDRGIRVNAVSPGITDTPGLNDLTLASGAGDQALKRLPVAVPLGRPGTPDEVARAVVFRASDDSSCITGTELLVDGGYAQV